ncbi:uracil phosphoribosyltransferase [Herbinix hemicellulosilytica]|uniref:Uracil phosphoribosyltransferase n=1 Tax=Herbinix hemicellulosilytica TaxID=1564487 RepID=A0A0H5SIP6_HERHM|nr:uracil phosphoribosyltransferase [Herbinix hemicellulosilytica]RBP58828.1 uracil phosphoribosyltransferase [Herbinix hemicellulosilytica]CRZ34965.1 Uracil phosphoribosyltransferase [Herbinix hemicellulosilytica]
MKNIFVFDHPLIQHKISYLRDKNTGTKEFRELMSEISMLMAYEVTRDLPLTEIQVETPIGVAKTKIISGKKLCIVPVLRAGLGMVEGIQNLIPSVKIGHIGLYRDHDTLQPVEYYSKFPEDISEREVIILEPMIASGGSLSAAVRIIKNKGVKNIKIMSILAARSGIEKLATEHPDVNIYCAAIDEKVNQNCYIDPGLGDAGDRLFGTK